MNIFEYFLENPLVILLISLPAIILLFRDIIGYFYQSIKSNKLKEDLIKSEQKLDDALKNHALQTKALEQELKELRLKMLDSVKDFEEKTNDEQKKAK